MSERFGIKTETAFNECVYIDGDIRITVLSEKIIRVEKCLSGAFEDRPSQFALNRKFSKPRFKATDCNDKIEVRTNSVSFYIHKQTCKIEVLFKGSKIKPDTKNNLGGTARTLDGTIGNVLRIRNDNFKKELFGFVNLRNGIMSLDGVTEYDDTSSVLLNQDGTVALREGCLTDKYVFAFGDDYLGGLKEFYALTGFTPLIPKYALGNWWSRYYAYSEKSYLALMDKFAAKEIPLTVATVDMDWHIVKNVPKDAGTKTMQGRGWTGYTFEKSLFPDYKRFLKELKNKNLAVTLNLHPKDGVRYHEAGYAAMAEANGIDPATKKSVPFNMLDKKFVFSYFDILHHPYEDDGVDFWWIDWQQGTGSAIKGLDPLWLLNHYHTMDAARNGRTPLILSRYAGLGSHRYPLGFSGDSIVCWKSLKLQPYFTATAANAGYTWWSHDIGGHMFGKGNAELYVRWLQFGVFSPINRLHSSNVGISKEPWLYGADAERIATEFLRLRHRMLPYLYTANVLTAQEGVPLVAPMYYYFKQSEAYEYKNQYCFGSEMFVAPIVAKGNKQGISKKSVWFPPGEWADIFTGKRYSGGKVYSIECNLETLPVFIKQGGVLPMLPVRDGNSQKYDNLEVRVYLGNNAYTVYDEKGTLKLEISTAGDSATVKMTPSADFITEKVKFIFCDIKGADIYVNKKGCGRSNEADVYCKQSIIELKNIVPGGMPLRLI